MNRTSPDYLAFLTVIKTRIRDAQYQALRAVNKELVALYWDLGQSIHQKQETLGWGKAVVETLAKDLQNEFPGRTGFSATNLWYMRQFYAEYRDRPILQPLVGEISWAKNMIIMNRCKDLLQREFYLRATARFGWTKAVLQHQIDSHLKIRAFEPEHKGKMEFYLEALDAQERLEGENAPIGIIICREKNHTVVEYALRTAAGPSAWRLTPSCHSSLKTSATNSPARNRSPSGSGCGTRKGR
jgi:predicted nuclease of restriction endonuclease-like (RecB) superfamily